MTEHFKIGTRGRIGLIAALGAGLLAPVVGGAFTSTGTPTIVHASGAVVADDGEGATTTPEAGVAPYEATPTPEATSPAGYQGDEGDQQDGSGDQGVADEGVVHDGQGGQSDESDGELRQQETNQVYAGADAFVNETTPAQNTPKSDQ